MSILGKFVNGLSFHNSSEEDDDYFLDDDYQEDEYEEGEGEKRSLFKKGGAQPASKQMQSGRSGGFLSRKIVPIDGAHEMEVTMIKPSAMEDSRDICDYLLAGKAVVLNMEGMNTVMAQRIIDFTLGAIYSMDGDIQRISNFIFIATPRNVELSGDFQGSLQNEFTEKASAKTQSFGNLHFGV